MFINIYIDICDSERDRKTVRETHTHTHRERDSKTVKETETVRDMK